MTKYFVWAGLLILSLAVVANKIENNLNDSKILDRISQKYSSAGVSRYQQWLDILKELEQESEWSKLHNINNFFNQQIEYHLDEVFWGKKDYWASPIETLGRGGGDCEDYAIAKYFSLISLGVPEEKLRLMYVRQLTVDMPHMVLIYFKEASSIPLVLDNFNPKVLPATKRSDLKPIYSFNGHGLWLSKAKGNGKKVRDKHGLKSWYQMLKRIEEDTKE